LILPHDLADSHGIEDDILFGKGVSVNRGSRGSRRSPNALHLRFFACRIFFSTNSFDRSLHWAIASSSLAFYGWAVKIISAAVFLRKKGVCKTFFDPEYGSESREYGGAWTISGSL